MSTNTNQPTQEEINALLAGMAIGELADAPEFLTLPDGVTRCVINFGMKKLNEKLAFTVDLKTIETLELANPSVDKAVEAGQEVTIIYGTDSEFGQGNFKKLLSSIAAQHGVDTESEEFKKTPLLDIINPFQGIEGNVVHKRVESKKEKGKFFNNIVDITLGNYVPASSDNLIAQSAPTAVETPATQAPLTGLKLGG